MYDEHHSVSALLPAGRSRTGELHAVDDDLASLCAMVDSQDLIVIDGVNWASDLPGRRCPACAYLSLAHDPDR